MGDEASWHIMCPSALESVRVRCEMPRCQATRVSKSQQLAQQAEQQAERGNLPVSRLRDHAALRLYLG